jgi:hypothetical protein
MNLFKSMGAGSIEPNTRQMKEKEVGSDTEQDDSTRSFYSLLSKQQHKLCISKLIEDENARLLATEKSLREIIGYERSPLKHSTMQTLIFKRSAMGLEAKRDKSKTIISRLQGLLNELEESADDANNDFVDRIQTILHATPMVAQR